MNRTTWIKARLGYLALIAAALIAHACAVERDEQAAPRVTATRRA